MRNTMKLAFAAVALLAVGGNAAHAQDTKCKGKVAIDTVYQKNVSTGKFEYFVQVRNTMATPIKLDLVFGGFTTGVTVFSPRLPGVSLAPHANQQIRFGSGTNSQINMSTVRALYDALSADGKAFVSANLCRP